MGLISPPVLTPFVKANFQRLSSVRLHIRRSSPIKSQLPQFTSSILRTHLIHRFAGDAHYGALTTSATATAAAAAAAVAVAEESRFCNRSLHIIANCSWCGQYEHYCGLTGTVITTLPTAAATATATAAATATATSAACSAAVRSAAASRVLGQTCYTQCVNSSASRSSARLRHKSCSYARKFDFVNHTVRAPGRAG